LLRTITTHSNSGEVDPAITSHRIAELSASIEKAKAETRVLISSTLPALAKQDFRNRSLPVLITDVEEKISRQRAAKWRSSSRVSPSVDLQR
jgi:hypothetical protein